MTGDGLRSPRTGHLREPRTAGRSRAAPACRWRRRARPARGTTQWTDRRGTDRSDTHPRQPTLERGIAMTTALPTRINGGDLAVDTRGLTKRFGDQVALSDVSVQVPVGAVYLLVGPNGAGKSTTLKVLLDLVRTDQGTAEVFGLNCRERAPEVRANIGYVPERPDWGYGWMRVGRLLKHHALYYPTWDADYATKLAQKFELRMDRKIGVLSKGQARRVHLTMALAHRPPLLLLDEPTDGLDPLMRDETLGVIADHLADSPTTVVLSTHHVEEVERLADHIGARRYSGATQPERLTSNDINHIAPDSRAAHCSSRTISRGRHCHSDRSILLPWRAARACDPYFRQHNSHGAHASVIRRTQWVRLWSGRSGADIRDGVPHSVRRLAVRRSVASCIPLDDAGSARSAHNRKISMRLGVADDCNGGVSDIRGWAGRRYFTDHW